MEDIEQAVKLGLNYPMGPFELMDLVGLNVNKVIVDYISDETGEAGWNAPLALKLKMKAGQLGRKTGAGWYKYE